MAFHHSILERTETKSFGDRSFKGWPPLLLQCHMSCYIAKWAVAGIVAGNLLPVLLPHSLHELAGNLLLHCQMSCGWDCSFPPPPAGVARLLSLLEAGVFAVHSLCVCHSLLANRQSPPPGLLWLEAGWNLPAPSCCLGWKLCKSPPPACFGWKLGEWIHLPQRMPALAGSWGISPLSVTRTQFDWYSAVSYSLWLYCHLMTQ